MSGSMGGRPRSGGMKPVVAAAIPLLTALGSWITTGTVNTPELSLVITAFVTALVVAFVPPQIGAFASSKAVAAALDTGGERAFTGLRDGELQQARTDDGRCGFVNRGLDVLCTAAGGYVV